jgi:hypothetical protein
MNKKDFLPFRSRGHDDVATQPSAERDVSMSTITIGVDLARSVFSVRYAWLARTLFDWIEQVQHMAIYWPWTYNPVH